MACLQIQTQQRTRTLRVPRELQVIDPNINTIKHPNPIMDPWDSRHLNPTCAIIYVKCGYYVTLQWSSHGNPDPWEYHHYLLRIPTKPISHVEFSPSRFLKVRQPSSRRVKPSQGCKRHHQYCYIIYIYLIWLVVGFNPSEKICLSKWVHLPNFRGENKQIFETTTQFSRAAYLFTFRFFLQQMSAGK